MSYSFNDQKKFPKVLNILQKSNLLYWRKVEELFSKSV